MLMIDMKIPKSCSVCPFNNSSCWCSITKSEIDREFEYHERLDDCPMKEVDDVLDRVMNKIRNLDADNMSGNCVKAWSIDFLLAEKTERK